MTVASSHVCHNATDMALIEGEVHGYPLATVFFYQVFEDGMKLVSIIASHAHTFLNSLCFSRCSLYLPFPSLSLQVVNSRVTITHPTDDSTSFRITFSDLMTTDQGTYMIRANNSVGPSNTHEVMLTVKGDI